MWAILSLVDNKGLRFNSALWVDCIMLPSGRITRGPCEVLTLLLHGISTLIKFCVAPLSVISYAGLLFGGFPLKLLELLLVCFKLGRRTCTSVVRFTGWRGGV